MNWLRAIYYENKAKRLRKKARRLRSRAAAKHEDAAVIRAQIILGEGTPHA